jgi:hypothetical protein
MHVALTHAVDQALPAPQGPWEPQCMESQNGALAYVQT